MSVSICYIYESYAVLPPAKRFRRECFFENQATTFRVCEISYTKASQSRLVGVEQSETRLTCSRK